LIAVLVSTMLVNIGSGAKKAKVTVNPSRLPEQAGTFGHPGDAYMMSVTIEDVTDLYAFGFTVKYAPYASVLVASDVAEGDFLSEGGMYTTAFSKKISSFAGTVKVGASRLGEVPGASGDGILVTFKMTVREAGESPIELLDVALIDSNGNTMIYDIWNSFYHGPTANLIMASMPYGRRANVGDYIEFTSKGINKGDVGLTVRTRFDLERVEDGRRITIYSGQDYAGGGLGEELPSEYIYLDEFNEWFYEFNNPATNALGTPDGAYIEGDFDAGWASLYSFEDVALAGREIAYIEIEGYSQYPNGATDDVDIDLYGFSGAQGFAWLGSNFGDVTWAWHGVRWTTDKVTDVMPELRDEAELNGMELMIYNYLGDAPDIIRVDSMRLKIFWSPIVPVVPPNYYVDPYPTEIEFDPFTIAVATEDMIGSYIVTATLEYTLEGLVWNEGAKTRSFFFSIAP